MSEESSTRPTEESGALPADFSGFIVSIAHAALVHLGEFPDPSTGTIARNVDQARYMIDLVDMFVEKTRGNLTPEEKNLILSIQSDLKLKFVRFRQEG